MNFRLSNLSVRTKILISSVLTLVLISLFIIAYYPAQQKKQIYSAMQRKDHAVAEMIALGVAIGMESGNFVAITEALDWAKRDANLDFIAVLDENNEVIASLNPGGIELDIQLLLVKDDIMEIDGHPLHAVNVPVRSLDINYGTLLFASSLEEINRTISGNAKTTLQVSLAILILGLALSVYFSRLITKPLARLRNAAAEVARGNKNVAIDITSSDEVGVLAIAFKEMIKSVRQAEEQAAIFRQFTEASGQGLAMATPDGKITYANPSLCRLLGEDKLEDVIGKTFVPYYPEELQHRMQNEIIPAVMERGQWVGELAIKSTDGKLTPTLENIFLIRDEKGNPLCLADIMTDITERKRAEDALRESEGKYRGLVENIDIGISLISPQMEILSQNRKMREWFPGTDPSKKQLCYKVCNFSLGEEICSGCPVIKTLKDGEVHETVAEGPADGEIRSYRIISSSIKDMSGNIVAAIEMVEDITEKLKMEEEHARTDKLESIGTLAGGIAHDFNNLLAGFMGNISMAKMDIDPESKAYNALERAESASVRATRLTLQLLTFAKGGAPAKELTSIPELIEDTASFALSGSNIKCDFQIPDDIWEVTVDKAQIGQAIRNLVQNAAQAMTDGGGIMISVENHLAESGGPVPLDEGKYIKISVKDQGSGIAEEHLQKIFEPYFTTKDDGSGLGLPAVYSIVKNHAGHVDVDSEVGVGTTFSVYLPATEKEVSPEPAAEEKIISGKGRVLVMEDEEMIRTMLEEMLEIIGYEVECTSDGAEAIELFKSEKDGDQPFDVLIIDLTIPGGMGGKEAMARIREIDSEVKSIVSSGYSSDTVVANFREYGFTGCLNKPYNTSQLSSVLDEVLTS